MGLSINYFRPELRAQEFPNAIKTAEHIAGAMLGIALISAIGAVLGAAIYALVAMLQRRRKQS
jgi:hypothetical protein